jgi:hypothetical protein
MTNFYRVFRFAVTLWTIALIVGIGYGVAFGQTLPKRLTVSFETASDRTGDVHDFKEINENGESNFAIASKANESHKALMHGVNASFQLNRRFAISGRALRGSTRNPMLTLYDTFVDGDLQRFPVNYHTSYQGNAYDWAARMDVRVGHGSVHVGYTRFGIGADMTDLIEFVGLPTVQQRANRKTSFEGVVIGVRGTGDYKKLNYGVDLETYPRLWRSDTYEHETDGNPEPYHNNAGVHALGVKFEGAVGYELYRGVGLELFGRIKSIYAADGDRTRYNYTNLVVPVSTYNHTWGVRITYALNFSR